ncbi:cytochrome 98A9, partial [Fusarium globosum]
MPDGPPTTPLLGNLLHIPSNKAFVQMTKWAKKYGDVYSLTVGPSNIIVLSGREAVKEVLDKKSALSSNRPTSLLRQQLLTGGDHLLWMDASPQWRDLRKLIHGDLTGSMCDGTHAPLQHAESVQMLPGNTPPVDIIPILNWVPERFLGNWKTRARVVHDAMRDLYDGLEKSVIERRQRIGSANSIVDRILDKNGKNGLTFHEISNLGGVTIKGGSDSSATVLANFVLAMVLHPEIQKKAQEEIDREIPSNHIPDGSDVTRLPYVMAIIKEVQRWRPLGGIGIPHQLSEDIWLGDKLLPNKSTVLLNVWALHQDEKRYPNPEKFDPDRYKGFTAYSAEYTNAADPEKRDHYAYGNGRRKCPGMHLAERNLFHVASKMLWAFDISLPTDPKTGKPVEIDSSVETGYTEGLVLSINDFPVNLKVRSADRRKSIEDGYHAAFADIFA